MAFCVQHDILDLSDICTANSDYSDQEIQISISHFFKQSKNDIKWSFTPTLCTTGVCMLFKDFEMNCLDL